MLRPERFIRGPVLGMFALAIAGFAQTPPQKPPALIRDTGVADGKTKPEAAKEKEKGYNPLEAKHDLEIGNYYFKQGNYIGAIERYRDAIEYQPNLFAAYDALGRAYEKKADKDKTPEERQADRDMALAVYRNFLKSYPSSPKAAEFRSRCDRLLAKK
jgi:tetratricopeptide (TPR) repeat protein